MNLSGRMYRYCSGKIEFEVDLRPDSNITNVAQRITAEHPDLKVAVHSNITLTLSSATTTGPPSLFDVFDALLD